MTGNPPAGWYPAPHANHESRYWDGQRWHDTSAPSGSIGQPPAQPAFAQSPQARLQTIGVQSRPIGLAVTALILGGLAFLTGLVPWLGLLLAIGALATGILALVRRQSLGLSIPGLVLGGIALVTAVIVTVSFTAFIGGDRTASPADISDSVEPSPSSSPSDPMPAPEPSNESEPETVEPEVPAEPEPPTADGSVQSPLPQPYVAKGLLGGEKYSLTARIIDPNANALVESWNQFNSDAPAGFKYVIVELTMNGLDPDGVEPSLASFDLELATGEGNRYSNEYTVLGDGMSSMSDGPTLYPGSSFTGYTSYIVPDSAQTFLLYDNRNYIAF